MRQISGHFAPLLVTPMISTDVIVTTTHACAIYTSDIEQGSVGCPGRPYPLPARFQALALQSVRNQLERRPERAPEAAQRPTP